MELFLIMKIIWVYSLRLCQYDIYANKGAVFGIYYGNMFI